MSERKPFWQAVWEGEIKTMDIARGCFCVGPQDDSGKCPCQKREETFAARWDRTQSAQKGEK